MARLIKLTGKNYGSWQECVDHFLIVKAAEGLSDRTLYDYKWHIDRFFSLYPEAWGDHNRIQESVTSYFAKSKDLAPATFNLRRRYLKSFFSWCLKEGLISFNPVDPIPSRRAEPRVRQIDEETLQLLLKAPDQGTFPGLRDYAMLCLALDCGIRPSEMVSLLIEDINLKSFEVKVRAEFAKTRKTRTLPISPITSEAIRKLIVVTPNEWGLPTLFNTCEGQSMTTNAWKLTLQRYSKKLNIKVSPYDLRHIFANLFLKSGGNVFVLRRMLGHQTMDMSMYYINLLDEDLKMQHQQASPLLRLAPKRKRLRKI